MSFAPGRTAFTCALFSFCVLALPAHLAAAIHLAQWDGTDNPWQSPHWIYRPESETGLPPPPPGTYPDNRADDTFIARVTTGTATLHAPVTIDVLEFPSGSFTGTVAGPFDLTAGSLSWSNGILRGPGVTRVDSLRLWGSSPKVLDGSTLRIGYPSALADVGNTQYWDAGPLRFDNGAVIDSFGAFNLIHDGAIAGSGGAFNNHGTLFVNAGRPAGRLEFGPNVAFHNFGELRAPNGTMVLSGGGSSTGPWHGAQLTVFDSGTHTFSFSGPSPSLYDVELRSGNLAVNTRLSIHSFVMTDGALAVNGAMNVGGEFVWGAGPISGTGVTTLYVSPRAVITGSRTKSLSGRTLSISSFSDLSYTSTSDLFMSDGAVIELVNDEESYPGGTAGAMTIGPIAVPALGTFRHAGGATPAFRNAGELRVIAPIEFAGVPFTNRDGGRVLIDSNGHFRTDAPFTQEPGSTTLLDFGTITTTLPLDNRGALTGAGIIHGDVLSTGLVQAGSPEPHLDASLLIEINGDLSLTETSTLRFPLLGRTSGTQHGLIDVNGMANFAGRLEFNLGLTDGSWIRPGDTFTVLTADASIPGAFANLAPGDIYRHLVSGYDLQIFYGPGSPYGPDRLVLACVPEPSALMPLTLTALFCGRLRRPTVGPR